MIVFDRTMKKGRAMTTEVTTEAVITSMADSIRAYIRTLRKERNINQDDVADAIGLAHTTYSDWERGVIREMKVGPLVRAVTFLKGNILHIQEIIDRDLAPENAAALAAGWLKDQAGKARKFLDPEEMMTEWQLQSREDAQQMTADELRTVLDGLERARQRPGLLGRISSYIDGLLENEARQRAKRIAPGTPRAGRRRRRGL